MLSPNQSKQRLVLVLLATHLLVSTIFVEAGLLDDLKKTLDRTKSKDSNSNGNYQAAPEPASSSGKNIPPRSRRVPSRVVQEEDETENLTEEIARMDAPIHRVRKPQKLTTMLAKMKDHDEVPAEESEKQVEEVKPPVGNSHIRRPGLARTPSNAAAAANSDSPQSAGRIRRPISRTPQADEPKHPHLNAIMGSKVLHSGFWKKEIKDAYKSTKDIVKELPTVVKDATDSLSALLKLDNRGRLLALIKEVDEDISFVRREFSAFSITWSPIMERALSYIGRQNLDKLNVKASDELDFRQDALVSAGFGYEFMRLMLEWRRILMLGHQAFRQYLTEVLESQEKEKFSVDEEYIIQLSLIHNYILLTCWLELDNTLLESRMKLDHLSMASDSRQKNYESAYFRDITTMQEVYDPTAEEFKTERSEVVDALSQAGQSEDQFKDVDEFFDEYRAEVLDESGEVKQGLEWETNPELLKFMNDLQPELRFNPKIYEKSFLKELKEAKEKAESEEEQ